MMVWTPPQQTYTLEHKPWGPTTQGPDEVETTSMEVHHASVVHFAVGAILVLPDGEWKRDRVNIRDPRARVLGEEPNRDNGDWTLLLLVCDFIPSVITRVEVEVSVGGERRKTVLSQTVEIV